MGFIKNGILFKPGLRKLMLVPWKYNVPNLEYLKDPAYKPPIEKPKLTATVFSNHRAPQRSRKAVPIKSLF